MDYRRVLQERWTLSVSDRIVCAGARVGFDPTVQRLEQLPGEIDLGAMG
jgi:hypothetical protein